MTGYCIEYLDESHISQIMNNRLVYNEHTDWVSFNFGYDRNTWLGNG